MHERSHRIEGKSVDPRRDITESKSFTETRTLQGVT